VALRTAANARSWRGRSLTAEPSTRWANRFSTIARYSQPSLFHTYEVSAVHFCFNHLAETSFSHETVPRYRRDDLVGQASVVATALPDRHLDLFPCRCSAKAPVIGALFRLLFHSSRNAFARWSERGLVRYENTVR